MSFRALCCIGLTCAAGAPFGASAQSAAGSASAGHDAAQAGESDKLQEVVVTAERRTSAVQKTADSISVRSGAEMESQGRYSLAQILEDVPGVLGGAASSTGSSSGSGTDAAASGLTIRGIQSNSGTGGSITSVAPAAAIYVDGVYEGVGGGYDIDRVEVLRGPQGTLYGRSATSGLVAIHTFDPDLSRFGGNASLEFGNYSLQHYTAAVNLPVVDNVLGLRVAGNYYKRNGYYSSDGGELSNSDGKIKLLYQPSENLSILFGAALQNNITHTGGVTYTLSNVPTTALTPVGPGTTTNTPVGPGSNDFRQYWALVNWNLGAATLTYQPAFRSWESIATNHLRLPGLAFDQAINTPKDNFITHELRLASNPASKLFWQVGALYYDNDLSNINSVFFPWGALAFNSVTREKTTRAAGLFAEATYPIAPSWRVTAGVRYDYTKVAVNQDYTSITGVTQSLGGDAGIRRFSNETYKARLEHDLTAENMLYASVSTGFSPGDVTVTTGITGNPVVLDLKAETLTAYEIGSKNRFLKDSLQVNGAIYYYDYGSYQTAGINVTPEQQGNPTFATLASPAQVYGGELEALYQLTSYDRLGVSLSYTNAYYVDKTGALIPTGTGSYVSFARFFARDKIPGVVPITSTVSYDRTVPLPGGSVLTLHGDVRYLSPYDGAAATQDQLGAGAYPLIRVSSQVVGDLNATWVSSNDNFSVTGYVRNVGDNVYKTFVAAGSSVNGGTGSPLTMQVTPSDPRTYGVVANVRF